MQRQQHRVAHLARMDGRKERETRDRHHAHGLDREADEDRVEPLEVPRIEIERRLRAQPLGDRIGHREQHDSDRQRPLRQRDILCFGCQASVRSTLKFIFTFYSSTAYM